MKSLSLIIVLVFVFFVDTSSGCTLVTKGIAKFDDSEYVFIGEVVGYTQPVIAKEFRHEAYGIVVNVSESVNLPSSPAKYFEVFPIGLLADCSRDGEPLYDVKTAFPLKTEVRVIAKAASILPRSQDPGVLRLEDRPGELGSISLNTNDDKVRVTHAESLFDYKSFNYVFDKDSDAKYLLPAFEIRKDLLRLSKAKNQTERNTILDRLFYAPNFADLDFYGLFKTYTSSETEFQRYYDAQLEMTDPETFKQYKLYKGALSELVKLGYKSDISEKALGKAIEQGAELTPEALLRESLKILKKGKK